MIRVYLRASTIEQDNERAKDTIDSFLSGYQVKADVYYKETISGTKLERPELMQLINDSSDGDILVVEQIDRLTRLTMSEWDKLKGMIKAKGMNVVSLDLPTSHSFLVNDGSSLTSEINSIVNNMLMDILATTARKDYEDMRRRQAEGIARAKAEGKYLGRRRNPNTIKKCKSVLDKLHKLEQANIHMPIMDICKLCEVNYLTFRRYVLDEKLVLPNQFVKDALYPDRYSRQQRKVF